MFCYLFTVPVNIVCNSDNIDHIGNFLIGSATMGMCASSQQLPENTFSVVNIDKDKQHVCRGTIEVTVSDIIYSDSETQEIHQWPLKYLKQYGCEGKIFTFEVGANCPGGEATYAFSTKRSSSLFSVIQSNINHGTLRSPRSKETEAGQHNTDTFTLSPSHSAGLPESLKVQHHSLSHDEGACAASGIVSLKSDNSQSSVLEPITYCMVKVEKPTQGDPVSSPDPSTQTTYATIAVPLTEERSKQRHFASGISHSFSHSPRPQRVPPRLPPSLTLLHSHTSSPPNKASFSTIPEDNYQNFHVQDGQCTTVVPQPNYANVTPSHSVADQQSSYLNITCGPSVASSFPSMTSGEAMMNYANIDIPGRTSTPKKPDIQPSYMQLEFERPGSPDLSAAVPQVSGRSFSEGAKHMQPRTAHEETVNYGKLDFPVMDVLSKLNEQRQQEHAEKREKKRSRES